VAGALLGLVGMVVVPVVGLPLGFVLGVYLAELTRLRTHRAAWPSTVEAMRGVGLSVLIGLCAAVAATGVWLAVAVTT
jgi:ABC-type phosphate transport system permease subunit